MTPIQLFIGGSLAALALAKSLAGQGTDTKKKREADHKTEPETTITTKNTAAVVANKTGEDDTKSVQTNTDSQDAPAGVTDQSSDEN